MPHACWAALAPTRFQLLSMCGLLCKHVLQAPSALLHTQHGSNHSSEENILVQLWVQVPINSFCFLMNCYVHCKLFTTLMLQMPIAL